MFKVNVYIDYANTERKRLQCLKIIVYLRIKALSTGVDGISVSFKEIIKTSKFF